MKGMDSGTSTGMAIKDTIHQIGAPEYWTVHVWDCDGHKLGRDFGPSSSCRSLLRLPRTGQNFGCFRRHDVSCSQSSSFVSRKRKGTGRVVCGYGWKRGTLFRRRVIAIKHS